MDTSGFLIAAIRVALAALILFILSQAFRKSQGQVHLPTYVPLEIAIATGCITAGGNAQKLWSSICLRGRSFFGVSTKHQIVFDTQIAEKLLAQPHHTVDTHPLIWTMLLRIFGASADNNMHKKLVLARKELFSAVERGFLSEAGTSGAIARANIPDKAAQLVTSATDHPELMLWERSAKADVIRPGVVEADLLDLLRDFGACIAIPLLYGRDFLERYPQCLTDIWTFDHHAFPLLAVGVPTWAPLKSLKHGLAARSRLLDQMTALYQRIDQAQTGQAVDFGADMSDVSQVALDRNTAFRKHNFSFRQRASTDVGLLIGQNANTQPTVFWFILFIYSTPGLVQQLRAEVAPHVTIANDPEGLSITRFDPDAIAKDCQLLKSTFLETLRLTDEPTSIRHVSRPLIVVDGMHEHNIQPGTWISVPHSVAHHDPSVFPSPREFIPGRFIETDSVTGRKVARYGRLKPWGGGFGICKGRTFAVKEVLAIGSAIIMLWDMAPADGQGWIIPRMLPGTGVARPAEDVRVVLKRRSRN